MSFLSPLKPYLDISEDVSDGLEARMEESKTTFSIAFEDDGKPFASFLSALDSYPEGKVRVNTGIPDKTVPTMFEYDRDDQETHLCFKVGEVAKGLRVGDVFLVCNDNDRPDLPPVKKSHVVESTIELIFSSRYNCSESWYSVSLVKNKGRDRLTFCHSSPSVIKMWILWRILPPWTSVELGAYFPPDPDQEPLYTDRVAKKQAMRLRKVKDLPDVFKCQKRE